MTPDPLRAALEDFMGWLFRDGGLEPPRREYDEVEQRLGLLITGLMNHPTAEARPELNDVRQRVLDRQARWMLSEGDEADARCGAYDDVLDIIEHVRLTEESLDIAAD